MNDPMTILKADHRAVKKMLEQLADSEEGAARDEVVASLDRELRLHMEIEESLVYPLVAKEVGAEDAEEGNIEHDLVREALEKLTGMTAAPGFGAVVEMIKGGITHHVHEEETELLPELKSSMERAEWMALGDKVAEAKAGAGAPPRQGSGRRSSRRSSSRRTSAA